MFSKIKGAGRALPKMIEQHVGGGRANQNVVDPDRSVPARRHAQEGLAPTGTVSLRRLRDLSDDVEHFGGPRPRRVELQRELPKGPVVEHPRAHRSDKISAARPREITPSAAAMIAVSESSPSASAEGSASMSN